MSETDTHNKRTQWLSGSVRTALACMLTRMQRWHFEAVLLSDLTAACKALSTELCGCRSWQAVMYVAAVYVILCMHNRRKYRCKRVYVALRALDACMPPAFPTIYWVTIKQSPWCHTSAVRHN